jgi:hypothetical protein
MGTMKSHLLRAGLVGVVVSSLSGCLVAAPRGEPIYEPAVVAPPVAVLGWWPWPHYEVEHHYVVEDEHVTIHDRHYFPLNGRSRAYIRNDNGQHKGWLKHRR